MRRVVVFYDVRDDRLRTKIANKLLDVGMKRIQKSVFYGEIKDLDGLQSDLRDMVKTDSVVILELCKTCYERVKKIGDVEDFEYPDFLFISHV